MDKIKETPFKIETVTAFVTIGPDGEEGVMGANFDGHTMMPFVCADESRIKSLYPHAVMISDITGIPFKVIQFSTRADITDEVKSKYGQ